MGDSLYKKISNPLTNRLFIKEMLYNFIYSDDLNKALTSNINSSDDRYSMIFHDFLFKNNYDDWVNEMTELYESLNSNDPSYNEIKTLFNFLSNRWVKNFRDVSNVLNEGYREYPELFTKYCWIGQDQNDYKVINTFGSNKFEHCLAINCDIKKMHLFLYKFYEKCRNKHLDYCFKFNETGKSNISIKIFCNTDDLEVYLNMVKEVIDENDLFDVLGSLPLVVGEISKGVGYLSGDDDFIRRRVENIEKCIGIVTVQWIDENFNSNMKTSLGREVPYKYYLFSKVILRKKEELLNKPNLYPFDEINTKGFSYVLTEQLLQNYRIIMNAILNKDYNYKFSIQFKSFTIIFTYDDFEDILKTQADYFKSSSDYQADILKRIKEKSYIWSIDSGNYGIDVESSYLLGKKRPEIKRRVTLDVLNNFDTNLTSKPSSSREGRILDNDISKKRKTGFFEKIKKIKD